MDEQGKAEFNLQLSIEKTACSCNCSSFSVLQVGAVMCQMKQSQTHTKAINQLDDKGLRNYG
jgi:SET domain-containing protein